MVVLLQPVWQKPVTGFCIGHSGCFEYEILVRQKINRVFCSSGTVFFHSHTKYFFPELLLSNQFIFLYISLIT